MKIYFRGPKMYFRALAVFLTPLVLISALPVDDQECLDGCPEFSKDKINVHLIAHSHDDVGWLKSYDQYYYGGRTSGVNAILSSVLAALKQNSQRRFIQVETAFFWKWWQKQSESVREDFKTLLKNGQIEIVNGGWVMNDEACTNYLSTIHQYTVGLRALEETLGVCGRPKVGWQIDPFGHSLYQAIISEQLGFSGVFMPRINYLEKMEMSEKKSYEFIWKTGGNSSGIYYNIMKNHYSWPTGFCFDILCQDDAINNDPESFDNNAEDKRAAFLEVLDEYAAVSSTGNILIPMGNDFTYQTAERNFENIDKLLELLENNSKYKVFYSTPSCYVKAVNEKQASLPVKSSGDFFPYAENAYSYWTGYYTSRPNSKRLERTSYNILTASKQLRSIFKMLRPKLTPLDSDPKLTKLQQAVAELQHHDAITGTEKEDVMADYRHSILKGIKESEASIGTIVGSLLAKNGKTFQELKLKSCLLTNMSICAESSKDRFVVSVYNPLSMPVTHYVRLPVSAQKFVVTGPAGTVDYDVFQSMYSDKKWEILFEAKDVPPMGINLYHVAVSTAIVPEDGPKLSASDTVTFGSKDVKFTLKKSTGQLESVSMNGITLTMTQNFYYYPGEDGRGSGNQPSGAYIFRPKEGTKSATNVSTSDSKIVYSKVGKWVDEVEIQVAENVKQIIRVYKETGNDFVEFDWLVGPIEGSTKQSGVEYVSRFEVTSFDNNGLFYTDSNGKEMVERVRDQWIKKTPKEENQEAIASNFYPVTSRISIRDQKKDIEVSVLNDRSQGGTSLQDGQIELMVHRRLFFDDGKGLAEPLNETEFGRGMIVRGRHQLVFGKASDKSFSKAQRELELKNLLQPYILVADATSDDLKLDTLKARLNFQLSGLNKVLPNNIQVITFERWNDGDNEYLLRLENNLEQSKDSAAVDLDKLFQGYKIKSKEEKSIGGIQGVDEVEKLEWFTLDGGHFNAEDDVREDTGNTVSLKAGEIRTFVITLANA